MIDEGERKIRNFLWDAFLFFPPDYNPKNTRILHWASVIRKKLQVHTPYGNFLITVRRIPDDAEAT
jgi:hypothetical protein